jgi:uncharacterized membrane protein
MDWNLRFRVRQSLKGNLWMLPLVGVIVGALVGAADARLEAAVQLPQSWQYSSTTAATLLAAIAGAMVALTGFVLTVSVLVVQMATETFSARYMRLFYRDTLQKLVLGVLVGTMTFAFSLLRRIEPDSVPDVGVTLAWVLVVVSLLLFVVFLDRFIHRLRPVAVAGLVARAGKRAFLESVAARSADSRGAGSSVPSEGTGVLAAHAPSGGSVQAIRVSGLVDWARSHDRLLVVRHPVGEFVPAGSALFEVHGGAPPTAIDERRLRGMVALGLERTIEQDPGFAVRIMVDIAIKALSAAINDPTTAVQVMDHLEDTLLLIGRTDLRARAGHHDADGRLRVVAPAPSWEDVLSQGVTEIRQYGASSVQVMRRLQALLAVLRENVRPEHRAAVDEELRRLRVTVERSFGGHVDLDRASRPDRQGIGGQHALAVVDGASRTASSRAGAAAPVLGE